MGGAALTRGVSFFVLGARDRPPAKRGEIAERWLSNVDSADQWRMGQKSLKNLINYTQREVERHAHPPPGSSLSPVLWLDRDAAFAPPASKGLASFSQTGQLHDDFPQPREQIL
jgi:hypothetical protein